jgi:hypothetical protein
LKNQPGFSSQEDANADVPIKGQAGHAIDIGDGLIGPVDVGKPVSKRRSCSWFASPAGFGRVGNRTTWLTLL